MQENAIYCGGTADIEEDYAVKNENSNSLNRKRQLKLSEMFGYVTQLRTLTSGRATSTMEFSHYNEAPNNVAADVISKAKGKAEKVN